MNPSTRERLRNLVEAEDLAHLKEEGLSLAEIEEIEADSENHSLVLEDLAEEIDLTETGEVLEIGSSESQESVEKR